MKKEYIVAVMFASVFVLLAGCSGYRRSNIDTSSPDNIKFSGNFAGTNIFYTDPGPEKLMKAYAIKKRADYYFNLQTAGEVSKAKAEYTIVVSNHTRKSAFVIDPESGDLIELGPDESEFLYLHNLPEKLIVKNSRGRIIWQPQLSYYRFKSENKKIFLGQVVDLIVHITSNS